MPIAAILVDGYLLYAVVLVVWLLKPDPGEFSGILSVIRDITLHRHLPCESTPGVGKTQEELK